MKRKLFAPLLAGCFVLLLVGGISARAQRKSGQTAPAPPAKSASAPSKQPDNNAPKAASEPDANAATEDVARLEQLLIILGVISAIGLMLPFPMCLYHFRRVRGLVLQIEDLQIKIRDQEAMSARLESLLARNEKLETEIKQLHERFRVTVKTAFDKHQETVDKLKGELQTLETEHKRISGLLLIKEAVKKNPTGK
jgi:hypothetical protein